MDLLTSYKPAAAEALARWSDPERRPLFKGKLIDADGCACAQGDILLHNGLTADDLRRMEQRDADKKVAALLGISVAHAILLRNINDSADGAPEIVLTHPDKVLGDQAQTILAFWRHLDRMTDEQWAAAWDAAWDAARAAAWAAAWDAAKAATKAAARAAAWDAAWAATKAAAWDAAWAATKAAARAAAWDAAWAAEYAVAEIMGAKVLRERGVPFTFLPTFGFADPEAVLAADEQARASETGK